MRLTVSTDGLVRSNGFEPTECHQVGGIDHSAKFFGTSLGGGRREKYEIVVLKLDADQALSIAYDLLYQAVDAGKIAGWNVQFPEEPTEHSVKAPTTFTAR